ncbi:MAG: HDOD domain-containing protein [Blastocatellia bacterium]
MSLRGEIQTMPLTDLFQWLEMMRKTGILSIEHNHTQQKFYLHEGLIATATSTRWHTTDSQDNVRCIFTETLQWTEGRFTFTEAPLPPEITQVSLKLGVQQLMLDIYREVAGTEEAARAMGAEVCDLYRAAPAFLPAGMFRLAVIGRLLQDRFEVPVLPTIVKKVMEITQRDDYSLRALSNVISADQVLAAQIIKHANSASFSGSREADSLPAAIQRLGSQAVTNVVIAVSMQSQRQGRDIFLARKKELWKHSLACALLARVIASTVRFDRDVAFLCGLMMDFGKSVLLSLIQDVMTEEPQWQRSPTEMVEMILDTYHPRVGGVVGEKWHLPATVLEAITCHHLLTAAREHRAWAAIASLSDTVANYCAGLVKTRVVGQSASGNSVADAPDDLSEMIKLPAVTTLNLTAEQLRFIIERGPECLNFAQDFLVR